MPSFLIDSKPIAIEDVAERHLRGKQSRKGCFSSRMKPIYMIHLTEYGLLIPARDPIPGVVVAVRCHSCVV
ncbi:hypothetical protein Plhal304r1_c040g0117431 [Plasmopara halstedii]